MLESNGIKGGFLEYKGRPLVREGNELYYGDLEEKYHVHMIIMSEKEIKVGATTESVPDKIIVHLLAKGTMMPEKQVLCPSFSEALETADAWLERKNK